jgi:hypothetical protein
MANTLINQFNTTIDQWIGYLDNYTLEELQKRPDEQSWSLGQVYIHLIEDTGFFVDQINEALVSEEDGEIHKAAAEMFANNAFPDMKLGNPNNSLSLRQPVSKEELFQGLGNIRKEINKLGELQGGKTKHPGLGYFNAAQWLQFAEMHLRHHMRQKNNIDALIK